MATSVMLHVAAVVLALSLNFSPGVAPLPVRAEHVTILAPTLPPPPRTTPRGRPRIEPKPVVMQRLAPRTFVAPRSEAPRPAVLAPTPAAPVIDVPKPVIPIETPKLSLPTMPIRTDNLSEVRVEAPPTAAPAPRPAGFSAAETGPARSRTAKTGTAGSFGDVTTGAAPGIPATKAPAAKAGFGDTQVAPAERRTTGVTARNTTAVEILFKPRPVYTEEARRLQIQGEVLLEVQFTASGEVRVGQLIRGLGHGLDAAASDAARQLRFRPATRDGAPVDSTAVVHIVFELAF